MRGTVVQAVNEADGTAQRPAPDRSLAGAVLVDDDVEPGPGQMRRRDFVTRGTARARMAADAELADVGRTSDQCPYLDEWVARFQAKPTADLERALVLYARPDRRTADGLLAAVDLRVRAAARQWKSGRPVEVPAGDDAGTLASATAGAVVQRRREGGGAGSTPPGRAADIPGRLGAGRPLDGSVRRRMEATFGERLDHVRVHATPAAGAIARAEHAHALAVGRDIVFAPGRYRPGTLVGDALLAHELTHTLQQSEGSTALRTEDALEHEADAAALAVASDARPPRVRAGGGLGLHACKSCLPDREPPPSLLDQLRDETDAFTLADELKDASDSELATLADGAPPGSTLAIAVKWERAWRVPDWAALATLARRSGERGLHEPYGERLMDLIVGGSTTITIDASDRDFADWVGARLEELADYPTGFRLLVELLATGKPIVLKPTTGSSQRLPEAGRTSDEGQLQIFDKGGKLLPTADQKPSAGIGSIVELNRGALENMAVPGGEPGAPEPIEAEAAVSIGHELIHALHSARGEAIPNPAGGLIPVVGTINPATGGVESISEMFTITGGREYEVVGAGRQAFNVKTDISENALRAERKLPARLSHEGVTRAAVVSLTGTETLDQLVDRYRSADGTAVPAPVKAAVRRVIGTWYEAGTFPLGRPMAALPLPTAGYVAMHVMLVERDEALSLQIEELSDP